MVEAGPTGVFEASPDSLAIGLEFARGALAGAMVIAAAYLAGFAVFRRGVAAASALLMVLAASALQFEWLGIIVDPSETLTAFLEGLFGAAAIVYLSVIIRTARENALIGGVMVAAALVLVGLGALNGLMPAELGGAIRWMLGGVGLAGAVLTVSQFGRDPAARLILPGLLILLAAPLSGFLLSGAGASSLAFNMLFTIGVLAASLVALTEPVSTLAPAADAGAYSSTDAVEAAQARSAAQTGEADGLSESQLAKVLDYSGIAIWDWSAESVQYTDGLQSMLGADAAAALSPSEMAKLIHADDRSRYESEVLAGGQRDGAFDATLRLAHGGKVRFRGARAVDGEGGLERLVAFVEKAQTPTEQPTAEKPQAAADSFGVALDEALARGELATAFQPIVSLASGDVVGYEALIRWPGANGGSDRASPEALVTAAEVTGRDGDIARFVLKSAAEYLSAQMTAQQRRDLFVAMNLSVKQLRYKDLVADVRAAIKAHDLPAKSLVLEITESQAITDIVEAGAKFRELKEAGAALAFDDFGAGFSSLSNLQLFEFDYLKIDKSFINGLARGGDGAKIACAIARLGRDLGLTVIAEGVETEETAAAALQAGCALGQGYRFGAPASMAGDALVSAEAGQQARRKSWHGALR